MKKYFVLFSALTICMFACQKEADQVSVDQVSLNDPTEVQLHNNDEMPDDEEEYDSTDVTYLFYLDGEQVEEGAFDPEDENIYLGITGDQVGDDKVVTLHAFTSETAYIQWGEANGFEVALSLEIENHLRTYAEENGVIEIYEETGEVPEFYIEYANAYYEQMTGYSGLNGIENRFITFIYHDFLRDGNSMPLIPVQIVMWPGFNNRVSCILYSITGSGIMIFDRWFFGRHMGTIWRWGWSQVNFWGALRGLNDNMSSAIIIGI